MNKHTIHRRQFINMGLKATGLLAATKLFPLIASVEATGREVISSFHSDPSELVHLLQIATRTGGDFADIFLEQTASRNLQCQNGVIVGTKRNLTEGIGIRVMHDQFTAFKSCEGFSWSKAKKAARQLQRSHRSQKRDFQFDQFPNQPTIDSGIIIAKKRLEKTSLDTITGLLKTLDAKGRNVSNLLTDIFIDYHDEIRRIMVANTSGVYVTDTQPLIDVKVTCTAQKGPKKQTYSKRLSLRSGLDFLLNPSVEALFYETASTAVELLASQTLTESRLPVALSAEAATRLTELLTQMLVNLDDANRALPYLPSFISLTDNGRLINGRGSSHFDDEGSPTTETNLIDKGKLAAILNQRLHADTSPLRLTGNARRFNYAHPPVVCPTNTILNIVGHPKGNPEEDLNDGLLITDLAPITVSQNIVTMKILSGYRVNNRQKSYPIQEHTISGFFPDILSRIISSGSDIRFSAGEHPTTGVPVSYGAPSLLFSWMDIQKG